MMQAVRDLGLERMSHRDERTVETAQLWVSN